MSISSSSSSSGGGGGGGLVMKPTSSFHPSPPPTGASSSPSPTRLSPDPLSRPKPSSFLPSLSSSSPSPSPSPIPGGVVTDVESTEVQSIVVGSGSEDWIGTESIIQPKRAEKGLTKLNQPQTPPLLHPSASLVSSFKKKPSSALSPTRLPKSIGFATSESASGVLARPPSSTTSTFPKKSSLPHISPESEPSSSGSSADPHVPSSSAGSAIELALSIPLPSSPLTQHASLSPSPSSPSPQPPSGTPPSLARKPTFQRSTTMTMSVGPPSALKESPSSPSTDNIASPSGADNTINTPVTTISNTLQVTSFSPSNASSPAPAPSPSPSPSPSPTVTNKKKERRNWRDWHHRLPPGLQALCKKVNKFMDGAIVLIIIAISTLVTIFLDDIKVTSFPPSSDVTFAGIGAFFLGLFGLELLINSLVKPAYFLSSYWLLDLISAFSLIPDIPWIWNPMIGLNPNDFGESTSNNILVEVEKIKRVSKNSEKLLRVLKVVKLIRLGRIAKLFEMAQRTLKDRKLRKRRQQALARQRAAIAAAASARAQNGNGNGNGNGGGVNNDASLDAAGEDVNTLKIDEYTQSSQVGQTLSEQTIRNVVLIVLLMLFGIPLLQPVTEERAERFMVAELNALSAQPDVLSEVKAIRAPDGTYTALVTEEEEEAAIARGDDVVTLDYLDLDPMLVNYQSEIGQTIDKRTFMSGPVNTTYLMDVVGPKNFSVCWAALNQSRAIMEQQFQWILEYYDERILYLRVRGHYYSNDYESDRLFSHRTNEMRSSEDERFGAGKSVGVFSTQENARLAASYSIWRTFTTLIILFIGAIAFDYNNKRMVIVPIERMVATIVQLRKNPLAKAVVDYDHDDPLNAATTGKKKGDDKSTDEYSSSNETGMLERTLQKLTGLLQVGFGDAGSRMIQKCMQQNSDGDLDPLVDGTRMLAIFGFCDIRRFTDATECLREDVMMYVNEIASIVHSHVSVLDGHPNKNVGDAFLVMWRLNPLGSGGFDPDDLFQLNEKQPTYIRPSLSVVRKRATLASQAERDYAAEQQSNQDRIAMYQRAKQAAASIPPVTRTISHVARAQLAVLADKAIVSFLRIIVDLDASEELRTYENHPRIKAAFDDFIVELGFGLHCGWSIEGPIGSRYKIDASYLSPHVNLSEALQDLTKIYGTPLLVSGEFYTLLSPYLKSYMRRVDVVKVVGRDIPMNLYAFDIHPRAMKTIIARQTPIEYDTDAEIEVVELKTTFWNRFQYAQPDPLSPRSRSSVPGHAFSPSLDMPMSPLPPGHNPHADPLEMHLLFTNPTLNPRDCDFAQHTFTSSDRERMQQLGPIATYHLVYNFRLSALQCGIPYAFYDIYDAGLESYLTGDWSTARTKMEECLKLYPEDVPTTVILDVMKEHQFVAPPDWQGWHEA